MSDKLLAEIKLRVAVRLALWVFEMDVRNMKQKQNKNASGSWLGGLVRQNSLRFVEKRNSGVAETPGTALPN